MNTGTTRAAVAAGLTFIALAGSVGYANADDTEFSATVASLAPCETDGVTVSPLGFSLNDGRFAGIRVGEIHSDCEDATLYVEVLDGAGDVLRRSLAIRVTGPTEDFLFTTRLEALPAELVRLALAVDRPDDDDDDDDDDHDHDHDHDHDDDDDDDGGSGGGLPGTGGHAVPIASAAAISLGLGALLAAVTRRSRRRHSS